MKTVFLLILLPLFLFSCAAKRSSSEMDGKQFITPTVYYIPEYDQSELKCNETRKLKDSSGKSIATVCKSVFESCLMQGTCRVRVGKEKLLLNVGSVVENERRFSVIKNSRCTYGKGASKGTKGKYKEMCLDPYYSVAADLDLYSVGDVIYIPAVVGLEMPDGSIHDGHFVVRDTGGNIKGYGRFDFFIGFSHPKDKSNPLVKLGFADKDTHVAYFKIEGADAEAVLTKRQFPLLVVPQ